MNEPIIPKPLVWILGVVLIVFIALLAISKGYDISKQSKDKTVPKNTISISAEGKITAVPDLATVSVSVISQGANVSDLQDQNSKKVNDIISMVESLGVDKKDITSGGPRVSERRDYSTVSDPASYGKIIGYEVNQTVTIKVRGVDKDTTKAGTIIDKASDNGANQISGVYYSFDDPDNYREQAREQAIAKAKDKAQSLAKTAGLELGKVVSVSESSGSYPIPYTLNDSAGLAAPQSVISKTVAPTLDPGTQDITADMIVVFEVK